MKTSRELVEQIIDDCKLDVDSIEEADPEFIPYIRDKVLDFVKLHVREAVKAQIRIENDRCSEKEIEELTDIALKNTYPLENIK